MYKRSLAVVEKIYGSDLPVVTTDLNNWAGLLKSKRGVSRQFPEV